MRNMKKALFLTVAALTLAGATTGCVGKNNAFCLFNGLAKWNRSVSQDKWVNELIFLGLNIIPVYGVFLFADVLVFNSIDFWTDDNPVKNAFAAVEGTDGQGNAYAIVPNGDGTATLSYKDQVCTLTRQGDAVRVTQDGVYLGSFTRNGSLVTFTGADGSVQSALR